jgi:hypothetical protein
VTASPGNITATGSSSPITVTGLTPQTAYSFSVVATNSVGNSAAAATNPLSFYEIVETFYEPMTQPRNSIFAGTFTYDSTNKTVSNLKGLLSESMTDTNGMPIDADHMVWLSLNNQLSSVPATLGGVDGLLVTTFKNSNTDTLLGGDGWSPANGVANGGVYFGSPGANPGNAYTMIFVNTTDPTVALTQAQIDKLAYADCTPTAPGGMMMGGGMMGSVCMTGTTVAGYGAVGTMDGYPLSQVITKR